MPLIALFLLVPTIGAPSEDDVAYRKALIAAVHHFVYAGDLEHLKGILDKHPDLVDAPERFDGVRKPMRTDSFTPLQTAAYFGKDEIAAYLIRRGANINAADGSGWTPLHLAAQQGDLAIVKRLVRHGADTHAKTEAIPESSGVLPGSPPASKHDAPPKTYPAIPSRTPLEWAVAMKRVEVTDYLKSLPKK